MHILLATPSVMIMKLNNHLTFNQLLQLPADYPRPTVADAGFEKLDDCITVLISLLYCDMMAAKYWV